MSGVTCKKQCQNTSLGLQAFYSIAYTYIKVFQSSAVEGGSHQGHCGKLEIQRAREDVWENRRLLVFFK